MPSEQDARLAQETGRKLAAHYKKQEAIMVQIVEADDQKSETIELPASAVRLLIDVLKQMAQGNAVTLLPIHAELTTQQAADLLGVSRPYLVGLLETQQIPFRKVGTHRRVLASDIFAYQRDVESKRRKTLGELTALDQELGLMDLEVEL